MLKDVKSYIAEAEALPNAPSILMEEVPHDEAKNCYHARYRLQKHYNDETYQLQLDSHHRALRDWDMTLVEMLHSCDAGEYSVITGYCRPYISTDPKNGYSETYFVDGPA